MLIPLMLFALALGACVTLALRLSRLGSGRALWVAVSAVLGYIAGGATVWLVTPSEWTLSFPRTLAASVDSATYGHPVEHYAESLLLVMLVTCMLGSVLFSTVAAFRRQFLRLR